MFLKGVVSTGEMIEMGDHEYEEVSKFQQPSVGEYEISPPPPPPPQRTVDAGDAVKITECIAYTTTTRGQTSLPPPPPSQQGTVDAGDDFEVTECIAYNTTTHGPPPPNTTSGDPLYDN